MKFTNTKSLESKTCAGVSLVEVMIATALSSLALAAAMSLWAFGSRSFAAMGNYTDLDTKSRYALDTMSRDIREATAVVGFQDSGPYKWLELTNAMLGVGVTYGWDKKSGTMTCQKSGEPEMTLLTGCERWDFMLYQRTPYTNGTYVFFPATNSVGVYKASMCKLINMTWKCSRTVLGGQLNTEIVQTAQVVLRNKQ